jgi:tetratricopeptide (TPR) repeat protein
MKMKFLIPVVGAICLAACGRSPEQLQSEYLEKGNHFFSSGKFRDASLNYRKALQHDPASGDTYYRLGLAELKQDNHASAFQALQRATQLSNDNRAKVEFADLCLQLYLDGGRRSSELRDHLERISRQLSTADPGSFDALRLSGYVAMFAGEAKTALQFFEQANLKRPSQPPVLMALSECLFREGRASEAERIAVNAIRQHPKYGPVYDSLYAQYRERRLLTEAQQVLESKVRNNPGDPAYRLQVAAHHAGLGNDAQMVRALTELLEQTPRHPTARLLVGDFYAKLGRLSQAIEQYTQGVNDRGPDKLVYQKRLVEAFMAGGRNTEAGTVVSEMLRDNPDDSDVRTKNALLMLATGGRERTQSAIAELTRLATARPHDADIFYYLGRAHLALGRLREANTLFLEALRRRSNSVPIHTGLAEVALRSSAPRDAIQYADRALAIEPAHRQARLLRASGLAGLGDYEAARKVLTRLLADEPGLPEALLQLGVILIAERKFDEAEKAFRASKEKIRNDLRPIEGLVETFAFQNRFTEAYAALQDSLAGAPNSIRLRALLASTAARAGNLELATQEHRRILSAEPGNIESHIQMSGIFTRQGKIGEAIEMLERACALAPKSAKVVGLLGFAHESAGRFEEAKTSYRKSLELQPGNPAIQNNLAFLIAETGGDLSEAQRLSEQSVKQVPANSSYIDTLGWVYLKKNMRESALKIFHDLASSNPRDPTVRYHLGMALLQSGNRAQAKVELQKALEQQPSRQYESKIRAAIAPLS